MNIEALACGTPVLAYDTDGPNAIIQNGENGVLIPCGESLETGIDRGLLISHEACIKSASSYDWELFSE